jgi:hypothetical protein
MQIIKKTQHLVSRLSFLLVLIIMPAFTGRVSAIPGSGATTPPTTTTTTPTVTVTPGAATPTTTPSAPATKTSVVSKCSDTNGNGKDDDTNSDGSCKLPTDCSSSDGKPLDPGNCQILKRLLEFTNLLSGLVAVIVIAVIIIGGIQYSAAGGDPQKVAGAKKRIYNAIFAFIAYIFMYSFLQWVVPGGVLNK